MIIGKHIKKQYGSLEVLKGVDLHIKESEVVSIVGSSGAGKTTLLTILGTLDRPSSGEILFNNINITSLNEKKLASFRNQHIGFVFQFHHLLPEFTAIENVCIPALIGKKSKKDAESIKMQTQLNKSIDSLKIELINKQTLRKQTVRDLQQRYVRRHWNTSYLDVAYGKSYKYDKDSKLDSLVLLSERNSLWVSGSLGLGKNWLLSGMAQYNLTATSDNYMVGTNLRYSSGNNNYNFFVELFREGYSQTPDLNSFTFAYGGDFKLGRNVLLSYAIRTKYSDKLHFKDVAPIANVICLMR